MQENINSILDQIIELVGRDVEFISDKYKEKQMDEKTAQTLCRYASTLASIKDGKNEDFEKEKTEYLGYSTDELIDMYNKEKGDKNEVR